MCYLKAKNVKQKLHENKHSITTDGLIAIDKKVEDFLVRIMSQRNGGGKRITAELVNLINIK